MKPFTVADAKEVIKQLETENRPENNELIAFYRQKITEVTLKVINKPFNNLGLRFTVKKRK